MQNITEKNFLEGFSFYDKLTDSEKEYINSNIQEANYKKGKIIFNSLEDCNGVILLNSGQLRAFLISEEGKEITLYRLLSNDVCILTASCLIKNIDFNISLEVEKDSILYFIPPNVWGNLNDSNIFIKEYTLELVSSRFSEVMWVMEQVVFKGLGNRLASFLIEQSVLEESENLKITHETIAKNLGTAREVISRMLKYFENEGLIKMSRGTLKITDLKRLRILED